MKCSFCKKIGFKLTLSLLEKEIIPNEFQKFETILTLIQENKNFPDKIIQCPLCGSFYYQQRIVDNEVMHNSDEIDFLPISKTRAAQLIQFQEKRLQDFSHSLDEKLQAKQIGLNPDEKMVINIFKSKIKSNLSFYEIQEELKLVPYEQMKLSLESLIKKEILSCSTVSSIVYYRII